MKDEVKLLDALDLYGEVMNQILAEMEVDGSKYTREELHQLARAGFDEFDRTYEEFILWVLYGDDQKAKTLARIRASRNRKKGFYKFF